MSKFSQRLKARNPSVEDSNSISIQENISVNRNIVEKIDINKIELSPYQPRVITKRVLAEIEILANNINEHGLMNPIIVRKDHGKYELIAGERRLRAIRDILKHKEIHAYVKYDVTDLNAAILALIDNTARENLTDYELVKSIKSICTEFSISLTNESYLLERFSLKRSEWSRLKSMLNLPQFIIDDLEKNPSLISANSSKILCAEIKKALDKFSKEEIENILQIEWKKFVENEFDPDAKYQSRPYIIVLENLTLNEIKTNVQNDQKNSVTQLHDIKEEDLAIIDESIEKHDITTNGVKRGSIQFKKSTKGANVVNLRVIVNSEDNEHFLLKFQEFLESL